MEASIQHASEKKIEKNSGSTKNAALLGAALLAIIAILGIFYWGATRSQIYTDKAQIEAPNIAISPAQTGTMEKILVKEGDRVEANTSVAQVANEILKTKQAGIVISADNNVGKTISEGTPVVSLINPDELRIIAHMDEDKGLSNIKVGQMASFTVDAFGSQKFTGIVDEVSASARQSGVVFNISDKREVQQFDVKIRFDVSKYPELKNGMSAKVTIYTK